MLFEQLDRLPNDEAAAARARRRPASLDAHHAVIAFNHVVFDAKLFDMELHGFQRVDHRGRKALGQGERRIMFGVAADLQHAVAKFGERDRQVGRRRRFADAAFAIDRENLRRPMLMLGSSSTCIEPSGRPFRMGIFMPQPPRLRGGLRVRRLRCARRREFLHPGANSRARELPEPGWRVSPKRPG